MNSYTGPFDSPNIPKPRRPRILFVHSERRRFVAIDLDLLSEDFDVQEWHQRTRFVNLFKLAQGVLSSDIVFGWFASWHTLLPAILAHRFNRPSVFVIGGYDTANMPEIAYGSQRGGIRRWVARKVIRSASRLVTNSQSIRLEAIKNAGATAERIDVIYHGIKSYERDCKTTKRSLVVTVGNVDYPNLQRKGLEPFVRAAAALPDIQFAVIGKWLDRSIDKLRLIAPPNVRFTGVVGDEELARYYREAAVYVQASSHEGFGLSLAEAMLAECVPVVTSISSLREVVGDAGIYVESVTPEVLSGAIHRALSLPPEYGKRARERIVQEFPLEKRKRMLSDLIKSLLKA
jgi:glycosyltransferase involved in cell wall biosynthesis